MHTYIHSFIHTCVCIYIYILCLDVCMHRQVHIREYPQWIQLLSLGEYFGVRPIQKVRWSQPEAVAICAMARWLWGKDFGVKRSMGGCRSQFSVHVFVVSVSLLISSRTMRKCPTNRGQESLGRHGAELRWALGGQFAADLGQDVCLFPKKIVCLKCTTPQRVLQQAYKHAQKKTALVVKPTVLMVSSLGQKGVFEEEPCLPVYMCIMWRFFVQTLG